jgi:hypothetical protein
MHWRHRADRKEEERKGLHQIPLQLTTATGESIPQPYFAQAEEGGSSSNPLAADDNSDRRIDSSALFCPSRTVGFYLNFSFIIPSHSMICDQTCIETSLVR